MIGYIIGFLVLALFGAGIRIVRPIEQGLVETLGKWTSTRNAGFSWIFPVIQRMIKVNTTEQMVDVAPQMVQTSDKLNTTVDGVVYYKIKDVKASQYNVDNHEEQLTKLSKTTLRSVIGGMTLTSCIKSREEINHKVEKVLDKETESYGVTVLRVEVQRIEPPQDVQEAMNMVVKAEQEKIAALDMATAAETVADGEKRAKIKVSEGAKRSLILEAEGTAESIKKVADARAQEIQVVNLSIQKNFKDSAVDYKKLETAEEAMKHGSKYVIDSKSNIMNVMSETAGVTIPVKVEKKK